MRSDNYLAEDAREVVRETRASWTCISRIEESIVNGDLHEAKLTAINLISSIQQLEKMEAKKRQYDRVNLLNRLTPNGIHIEMKVRSL